MSARPLRALLVFAGETFAYPGRQDLPPDPRLEPVPTSTESFWQLEVGFGPSVGAYTLGRYSLNP